MQLKLIMRHEVFIPKKTILLGELCNRHTGFASGGVTCKRGAFCFYSSSVLVDSFVLRNPPERKARKRWQQG
ncbi:hypothetical protein Aconfl_43690 [Algoriphagus confluentis]|uniref:Uncharacterized protein n=1 Tax=Algoriphagus confluentis TaxID=1697556 RepID=A0ABQ6PUU7_9BACT|nr:hypothetical protein Aconfl_43690 [Algoriphagus confluentis]